MTNYPKVHGEYQTLSKLYQGYSISRIGDGEIGVLCGKGYTREQYNKAMTAEMNHLLHNPIKNLLIGIPTMDPKGCRYWNWKRHIDRYTKLFPADREYYSALISRPDCGEWMQTIQYAKAVQKLWLGKRAVFVGSEIGRNKMLKAMELTQEVKAIECNFRGAYSQIDELEQRVLDSGSEIAILSHGASATCLAARLSPNMQAIDLGSIGGFLIKMLAGDKLTEQDKQNTGAL